MEGEDSDCRWTLFWLSPAACVPCQTRALYQLLTVLGAHLSSASPAHRCSSLNTFVSDNFQSSKHILNQPADVNAELVKKALNPDARQWSWLARNVALRSALPLGSPTTSVLCQKGLSIADVADIRESVVQLKTVEESMPKDCTSVASRGALGESTTIDKVEWSWSDIHVADPDFHLVWRLLNARFLGGNIGGGVAAAAPSDGGAPAAASAGPARGGRPPTTPAKRGSSAGGQSGRGTKRAEAEPVVPSPTSVRRLRHRKAAGKYAKTLEVASSLFVEQEQRATVVRPPFVLGHVKPFSKRPFGAVVVYAQFPSLLDTTWKKTITWTAYCRKVLIQKKGGRYEIVFKPNRVLTEDSVGQRNGNEPLARADDAAAVSAAAAAAAAGTGTGTVLALGTENESAGEGAGAAAGEDEGTEEPGEDSDVDQDVGPTAAMDASAGD